VRVTIVSQYFWPEQFRVNDLAVGLRARGHEVTVLTGQPSYPRRAAFVPRRRPSREWYEGVEVVRVPLASRGAGEPWRLALNYLTFAASASLLGPWRVPPADVVLVFQMSPVTMALPAYLLRRLRGVPVVLWVQDLWPHTLRATGAVRSESLLGLLDRLVRAAYRRSARVLAQSEDFLPLLRQAGVPAERLDYVPNWAEEHYRPVPADPAVRRDAGLPDGFVVMFAGNLGVAQSLETVVDAAERLRDHPSLSSGSGSGSGPDPGSGSGPDPGSGSGSNLSPAPAPKPAPAPTPASASASTSAAAVTAGVLADPPAAGAGGGAGPGGGAARDADLHWVVLGDGQRGEWLAAEVARRGLGGTVHLLGRAPVEQMPALFAHADVLVATLRGDPVWALTVPSRVQSFLACGRPVVAAADGTCARVVTAAGGLAVPAGDGTALAAAIATVRAMDPARRAEMGAVAREYYLKNFDRAALLDRIEGHLAHVAHAHAVQQADATHGVHSVDAAKVAAAARTRRPGRGSRAASAGRPR
jgi:glycosyltransferase involved in cell wall biosynthesis